MAHECLMTIEARAAACLSDDWHAWKYEAIANGVLVTGGVCPRITRGPNKGRPNLRKPDPATVQTVFIPFAKEG